MNNSNENIHKVLSREDITDSTFILKFERKNINFTSGQHIGVGPAEGLSAREYSIYSGVQDKYIEILVKEVKDGMISPQLKNLNFGDFVIVDDPVGVFSLSKKDNIDSHIFIASGTGIAPFCSFVRSEKLTNYKVVHGVKYIDEAYGVQYFDKDKYVLCTSIDENSNYHGRVTEYMKNFNYNGNYMFYLCGNSNMIHDMYEILEEKGVSQDNIIAEVYF